MNNTFYRPAKVNVPEFFAIVKKLESDLNLLLSGQTTREEALAYAAQLAEQGISLPKDPRMMFWGLEKPENMPSDARVDFLYRPTYVTVCFLARVRTLWPDEALKIPSFSKALYDGMFASTGRAFKGHGIEWLDGLFDTLSLFGKAGIPDFVRAFPQDCCPEFVDMLHEAVAFLSAEMAAGGPFDEWSGKSITSKAATALAGFPEVN